MVRIRATIRRETNMNDTYLVTVHVVIDDLLRARHHAYSYLQAGLGQALSSSAETSP